MERKSYAREAAGALMLFLCALFVWGAGWNNEAATEAARFLTTPVFGYFLAIFGGEKAAQIMPALKGSR